MSRPTAGLCFASCAIDAACLGALATRARETGRVIERDGLAIFGLGTAAELKLSGGLSDPAALERAVADLGSIVPFAGEHDLAQVGPTWGEDQAPVPIALGALAFDRRADGVLVVPELTVVSSPNRPALAIVVASAARVGSILTTITHAKLEATSFHGELAPPDEFRLASARPHHDFLRRVAAALVEIASGRLDKVVLAREVTVHANRPFRQADLVSRLRALHPSCTTFAIDGFIGASPELLISRRGAHIASKPLAGTAPRSGDPDSDRRAEAALLSSAKERSEHRVVVETIAAGLSPVAEHLEVPEEPLIFELRNVSHLGTLMTGTLARRDGAYPTSLDLVGLLHPTPAVAGTPADLALDYLSKLEEIDRDRYAGPLGWVDARGDGEWHLGIRSAIVSASSARLFAGVGIVADSDPASELAETQLKLQAFLAAAVRP